jgi:hypothetical protein
MAQNAYDSYDYYKNFAGQDNGCCSCANGLVEVKHPDTGDCAGCLSPNDAERYQASLRACPDGYVKVWHPNNGMFVGCLTVSEAEQYQQLSP